jgi:hypothetical protein
MKNYTLSQSGGKTTLTIEAGTKAGLVGALLMGVADALGALPKESDAPKPEITGERNFSVKGSDIASTLTKLVETALTFGSYANEAFIEAKLTLVTDGQIDGVFMAIGTGTVKPTLSTVEDIKGPEKNDSGKWVATIILA